MHSRIKKIVSSAKKNRLDRVYYRPYKASKFQDRILQPAEKSQYDCVTLEQSKNEFIHYYGFAQDGSHFSLHVSILSLYPDVQRPKEESKWRLATASYVFVSAKDNCRYWYLKKELIDYEDKRRNSGRHDVRNTYKIGSISVETVIPFALTRILFNGVMNRTCNATGLVDLVQARLNISTHPTCDKFDYKYKFDENHMTSIVENSSKTVEESEKLLNLCLEDRIDQTLMFQGQLELIADSTDQEIAADKPVGGGGKFLMWGGRLRKYIDPCEELSKVSYDDSCERESMLIYAECGHAIHLNRLVKYPNVVYGMLSSAVDYPSHFCKSSIYQLEHGNKFKEVKFSAINSFSDLLLTYKVDFMGFGGTKNYSIEVLSSKKLMWPEGNENGATSYMKVKVNGFDGWALIYKNNFEEKLRHIQRNLCVLDIQDDELANRLASVQLLGGKGNSLVEMVRFMKPTANLSPIMNPHYAERVQISVPRALVFTCVAYQMWLRSDPAIGNSVRVLDDMRKCIAASSVCLNPMSEKFLSLMQRQQTLTEHCKRIQEHLRTIPLSEDLKKLFYFEFVRIFGKESLGIRTRRNDVDEYYHEIDENCPMFAIRSSAVGEDSLETSAAGQMKTLLCVRGFDQICKAVVECWASQFDIEAVTYKTQNGLPLHMPMAVVVQKQIQCEVAGVASTCDPLTGNKSHVEILANPGIGEGVVSGRETDTIRVSMLGLPWDATCESPRGYLTLEEHSQNICIVSSDSRLQEAVKGVQKEENQNENTITTSDSGNMCCLTNERIISLANLLIQIRRANQIRDREIEWGITSVVTNEEHGSSMASVSSASSSSSSSSEQTRQQIEGPFHIHLLQSRPLTHLARLSAREIDHELDSGFAGPMELCSRANLGEVMPGALCPINITYFQVMTSKVLQRRPFDEEQSNQIFVSDSFGFYRSLGCMVLTHNDVLAKFTSLPADRLATQMAAMHALIGTTMVPTEDIREEKLNPLAKTESENFIKLLLNDTILIDRNHRKAEKLAKNTPLEDDLTSLEALGTALRIETMEMCNEGKHAGSNLAFASILEESQARQTIRKEVKLLFERLCISTEPLIATWTNHIRATLISIAFNMICMIMLSRQPSYPDQLDAREILNDFSVLIRGEQKTESGDVSHLLDQLVGSIIEEGKLDEVKKMSNTELYNYLAFSVSQTRRLYDEIMEKNGHRAFKEFDFASQTWADDPSTLIKSLKIRLKQAAKSETRANSVPEAALVSNEASEQDSPKAQSVNGGDEDSNETRVKEILERLEKNKHLITGYLLPRARNAVVRREKSKSLVIKTLDKYRKAFRHLGGLLCLEGRLPSADLVFQLTFQELNQVVHLDEADRVDLSRLIYKARRRQQRARTVNQINFPQPNMKFAEVYEFMSSDAEVNQATGHHQAPPASAGATGEQTSEQLVRGITSCAGCVTGRACVVQSLDDMNQVEPNDILITYSIDISWSVYFFCLAGIVTEVGGIVSHGAVIAREYGIPTLCTAVGACTKFQTGQMVTLNANEGTCYLAKEQTPSNGSV